MIEQAVLFNLILKVVQILIIPLAGLFIRQMMAMRKEIEALKVKVTENEAKLCNMPDSTALHNIAISLERLRGDVVGLGAEMGGMKDVLQKVDRIVERQENYLLNNGGK